MCYWLFIFYGSIYEYVQPVTRTNFLVQILWVLESWKLCAVSIKKKIKKKKTCQNQMWKQAITSFLLGPSEVKSQFKCQF